MGILLATGVHSALTILEDVVGTLNDESKKKNWQFKLVVNTGNLACRLFSAIGMDQAAYEVPFLKPLTQRVWVVLTPLFSKFLQICFKNVPELTKLETLFKHLSHFSQGSLTLITSISLLFQSILKRNFFSASLALLPIAYSTTKHFLWDSSTTPSSLQKPVAKIHETFNTSFANEDLFSPALLGFLSNYPPDKLSDLERQELKEVYKQILEKKKLSNSETLKTLKSDSESLQTAITKKENRTLQKTEEFLKKANRLLPLFSKTAAIKQMKTEPALWHLHQAFPETTKHLFFNDKLLNQKIIHFMSLLLKHYNIELSKPPNTSLDRVSELVNDPPNIESYKELLNYLDTLNASKLNGLKTRYFQNYRSFQKKAIEGISELIQEKTSQYTCATSTDPQTIFKHIVALKHFKRFLSTLPSPLFPTNSSPSTEELGLVSLIQEQQLTLSGCEHLFLYYLFQSSSSSEQTDSAQNETDLFVRASLHKEKDKFYSTIRILFDTDTLEDSILKKAYELGKQQGSSSFSKLEFETFKETLNQLLEKKKAFYTEKDTLAKAAEQVLETAGVDGTYGALLSE